MQQTITNKAVGHTIARLTLSAALLGALCASANADVVTDWNVKAGDIIIESRMGTPPAVRVMAIVQTAVYEAVNGVTGKYPSPARQGPVMQGTSLDAAVAAANRITLGKLIPSQQANIDKVYQSAIDALADGPGKAAGITMGEKAAAVVLAMRADDGAGTAETYRPHAAAGSYVPTAVPAVPQWLQRKPWHLGSAAQFRPGPPPALTSETWVRDFNEVKALGSKASTRRTPEQTEIARFWEFSLPSIYHGVVRSVAEQPGRDVTRNARLFATIAQAMDDAMISVFEAKYHYNFWRPVTAIRNGDIDGSDATERDPSWTPFIDTPMHPEYPSAHSILAASVAAVLRIEIGNDGMPVLMTTSPTAKGVTRRWKTLAEFTREVGNARIYEGVHYRTSADVGTAMGERIGELVATRALRDLAP